MLEQFFFRLQSEGPILQWQFILQLRGYIYSAFIRTPLSFIDFVFRTLPVSI